MDDDYAYFMASLFPFFHSLGGASGCKTRAISSDITRVNDPVRVLTVASQACQKSRTLMKMQQQQKQQTLPVLSTP